MKTKIESIPVLKKAAYPSKEEFIARLLEEGIPQLDAFNRKTLLSVRGTVFSCVGWSGILIRIDDERNPLHKRAMKGVYRVNSGLSLGYLTTALVKCIAKAMDVPMAWVKEAEKRAIQREEEEENVANIGLLKNLADEYGYELHKLPEPEAPKKRVKVKAPRFDPSVAKARMREKQAKADEAGNG